MVGKRRVVRRIQDFERRYVLSVEGAKGAELSVSPLCADGQTLHYGGLVNHGDSKPEVNVRFKVMELPGGAGKHAFVVSSRAVRPGEELKSNYHGSLV